MKGKLLKFLNTKMGIVWWEAWLTSSLKSGGIGYMEAGLVTMNYDNFIIAFWLIIMAEMIAIFFSEYKDRVNARRQTNIKSWI